MPADIAERDMCIEISRCFLVPKPRLRSVSCHGKPGLPRQVRSQVQRFFASLHFCKNTIFALRICKLFDMLIFFIVSLVFFGITC